MNWAKARECSYWITGAVILLVLFSLTACGGGSSTSSSAVGPCGDVALINNNDVIVLPGRPDCYTPGATAAPVEACSTKSFNAGEC